ncbi:TetR/AcrR family transcriptional regulator [Geodermatophilus sp. SYSU D00079]
MTVGEGFRRPENAPPRTRTGSRRLDPARDEAIAAAVLEVLAREGYAGLTMDAVAMAAGVGKATIYRRWSSKADLLLGVLDVAVEDELPLPDTGNLRDDLVVLLTTTLDLMDGPAGRATRSLLGAVVGDPALAEASRRGPLAAWSQALTAVLERAVDRGEITAAAAASCAAEVGPAVLLVRWLVTGRPLDATVVTELVDEAMMPLLRRR